MKATPKYDLTDYDDHRSAARFFESVLNQSYALSDDPEALAELSYRDYFEPTMDERGALYDNTTLDPAVLRISANQFEEAEALFSRVSARAWIGYLEEQGDPNLRAEGSLHVVCTGGLAHESRFPRRRTAFRFGAEETAEKLASALEREYDDRRYTLARRKADGTYKDVYKPRTYALDE